MFNIKDKVDPYLLVTIQCLGAFAQVLEGLAIMELYHLKGGGVLPLDVTILVIQFHSMMVVPWNFISILVPWCHLVGLQFCLVGHSEKFLVLLGNTLELSPTICVKEVVVPCIDCTGNRIVGSNDGQGFRCDLPIFPFNHDIELRPFEGGVCQP